MRAISSTVISYSIVAVEVLCLASVGRVAESQSLLDPNTLTKYLDPLPNPLSNVLSPVGTDGGIDLYNVEISQFTQNLHSELPDTTVWGYNGTYPGPTFDVDRGVPVKVDWVNSLVDGGGTPLPHFLPYDFTVHGAEATFPQARTVSHLHGGVVEPESDGFPEHWFSADPAAPANGLGGPAGNSVRYTYHNQQPASTLWYHDHAMGITRLNVYAGLAGFYLLRDDEEAALNLPSGDYEVPLVLQDRSFYDDGQLYYPSEPDTGLPAGFPGAASVVDHFFGDTNLVNGVLWPFLEVEPRKYRFRIINGANSRFYDLKLEDSSAQTLPFHQIGSDGGLLEATTNRTNLLMAPAERADVIVDFSNYAVDEELFLRNFGPDGVFESPSIPFTPADPSTTGQVMQFKVVAPTGTDTSSLPTSLVSVDRIPENEAIETRQLSLVDDVDEFGRPKLLLDGTLWTEPTTELPLNGTTEIWEITNSTVSSHPVHLHLVQFQVLDRFARPAGGGDPVEIPLEDHELGWKDTVKVNRRETVRVIARFEDFEGLYVWHCHILEHEDHEMMRRYEVVPGPELVVEQGVTLSLSDPHTVPAGHILSVDGTFTTPSLSVDGLLRGAGVVQSGATVGGRVSPGGAGVGALAINGDATFLGSSKLTIDLTGTSTGQFDTLSVSGAAALDGVLSVELFDTGQGGTHVPMLGDTFEILTAAGGLTGVFDLDVRTSVAGGFALDALYGADAVQLVVASGLAGDYNNDGVVGAADYTVWRDNAGAAVGTLLNDKAGGAIGVAQYNDWSGNFGASLPAEAPQASVNAPEPASLFLLVIPLAVLACRGLRRRTCPVLRRAPRSLPTLMAALLVAGSVFGVKDARGATVSLTPTKDNTLYEIADGSLSNGSGSYLFAGRTAASTPNLRRAVMAFDIPAESIPAGSIIQSVTLTLDMNRANQSGAADFDLHRLLADWGEGASNAPGQEGGGDDAAPGDATWLHTFYSSSFWAIPGGDFASTSSASTSVNAEGQYTWGSTAQLVTDVQGWVDSPASNFGWLLKGPEDAVTAKRFTSSEGNDPQKYPTLVIDFISTGPLPFNWIGANGGVFQDDANWDTGFAPSSPADVVNLVNTGLTDQVVTLSGDITIGDLTIDGLPNSMQFSIERGQTASVGDLQIGGLGGIGIELGKNSLGQLFASGAATLAGTLSLTTQGPTPSLTDTYEFMTYASRSGSFDEVVVEEIQPGLSFSVHYDDSRALAIVGEWDAAGEDLTGDFDVPADLLVSGAWNWNGALVKRGDGELVLDLDGGFTAGAGATLAIVDGVVRLRGTSQTLSLASLDYGELGLLSGDSSLDGLYGWYGAVNAAPEPHTLMLLAIGGVLTLCCSRNAVRGAASC